MEKSERFIDLLHDVILERSIIIENTKNKIIDSGETEGKNIEYMSKHCKALELEKYIRDCLYYDFLEGWF